MTTKSKSKAKAKKKRAGTGQRSKSYQRNVEPYLDAVREMSAAGMTLEEIAKSFDIAKRTIQRWKGEHDELRDAIETPAALPNFEVASMIKRAAMGYTVEETHVTVTDDGGRILKKVTKHIQPNITAAIFYLKNRDPERWRDRQEITGAGGGPIQLDTDLAKQRLITLLTKRIGGDDSGDD